MHDSCSICFHFSLSFSLCVSSCLYNCMHDEVSISFLLMCDLLNQSIYSRKFMIVCTSARAQSTLYGCYAKSAIRSNKECSMAECHSHEYVIFYGYFRIPFRCSTVDKQIQLIENYLFCFWFARVLNECVCGFDS